MSFFSCPLTAELSIDRPGLPGLVVCCLVVPKVLAHQVYSHPIATRTNLPLGPGAHRQPPGLPSSRLLSHPRDGLPFPSSAHTVPFTWQGPPLCFHFPKSHMPSAKASSSGTISPRSPPPCPSSSSLCSPATWPHHMTLVPGFFTRVSVSVSILVTGGGG